jgi:hypothetical protein
MTEEGLSLRTGAALTGLSPDELWARYLALTGVLTPRQLTDLVEEVWHAPPPAEWNIAAHAINERLMEQGLPFAVRYLDGPAP